MNAIYIFLYNYLSLNLQKIIEYLLLLIYLILLRRFKISGQKTALFGFIALFITMIFNLFYMDTIAGVIADFVWLLFVTAFIQEFSQFLKHENKK
jgi:hypothetical protein